jgi:hypothetical protein
VVVLGLDNEMKFVFGLDVLLFYSLFIYLFICFLFYYGC